MKELDEIRDLIISLQAYENIRIDDSYLEELDSIKDKLKAFEIIKKKGINIYYLKETDNVDEYNELIKSHLGMKSLAQEEYDILKEELL